MTDDTTIDPHEQARMEAEERLRTFLWHEGVALRLPVEMGYVALNDAVSLLVAAYRRVLENQPELVLAQAFDEGGPAPAERSAEAVDALVQAAVQTAKPRAHKIPPTPPMGGPKESKRPLLRIAPEPTDEGLPTNDGKADPPTGGDDDLG